MVVALTTKWEINNHYVLSRGPHPETPGRVKVMAATGSEYIESHSFTCTCSTVQTKPYPRTTTTKSMAWQRPKSKRESAVCLSI